MGEFLDIAMVTAGTVSAIMALYFGRDVVRGLSAWLNE